MSVRVTDPWLMTFDPPGGCCLCRVSLREHGQENYTNALLLLYLSMAPLRKHHSSSSLMLLIQSCMEGSVRSKALLMNGCSTHIHYAHKHTQLYTQLLLVELLHDICSSIRRIKHVNKQIIITLFCICNCIIIFCQCLLNYS